MANKKRSENLSETIMRYYYKKYAYIYKRHQAPLRQNTYTKRFNRIRLVFLIFNLVVTLTVIAIIAMVFL